MKNRITVLFLGFLCFFSSRAQPNLSQTNGSPNVIIILVDDLGFADVGFNGCEDIKTPNIDRIAKEGVTFTNAYVSYAVCGPSRAGLITGRYQDRFGFGRNPLFAPNDANMGVPKTEEMLPEVLQTANYKSIAIGKWHLGAHESLRPLNRGFDDFFGFLTGGHSYFPELWKFENEYSLNAQFDAYYTKLLRNATRVEEDEYLTDALSREAVNYIDKYKDQPFFMYLAYNAPHTPLQASEKYLNRYRHIEDKKRRTYAAMVSAVDDGVGRILDQLNVLDLTDNTMIFFLSDNGGPEKKNASDNGILRGGKSELYEGGIRVPFALKWPNKIPEGLVYEKLVSSLDIFATVIAQSEKEISTKNKLDGVNLIPFIRGENKSSPHDFLAWRKFDNNQYAIRNSLGNKIVVSSDNINRFDLVKNISEDPSLTEKHTEIYDELKNLYLSWENLMMDPIFLGLRSDDVYNKKFPNRFKKPD